MVTLQPPIRNLLHKMSDTKKPSFPSREHRTPNSSPLGIVVFSTLRLADPILQHAIITRHLGVSALPEYFGGSLASLPFASSLANVLDLPPYHQLMLGMSLGSALKQIFWLLGVSQQELPVSHAVAISAWNTAMNSVNTALSLWSLTTPYQYPELSIDSLFNSPSVLVGTILYATGILTEIISEIQRSRAKKNPANAGKPYTGGLFGFARHINYTGYMLWRTGYALTAGGPIWGFAIAAFNFRAFSAASVPELDGYCQKRVCPVILSD
jgi:protein-S-isoprenylcysteine O-methyltransferase Ste14